MLQPPASGEDWVGVCDGPLPVDVALAWTALPSCGAQVLFTGIVRDHADGRSGVTQLAYEAYEEQVVPRMRAIVGELRERWPDVGRTVVLHRTGELSLSEVSVLVVISAPHRAEAFAAARYAIDAVKATAPIWKKETWEGGVDWGTGAQEIREVTA